MQNLTNLFSQAIKKNIKLLSEKYNHQLFFHENIIFIKNEKNLIEIYSKTNEIISIKYNLEEGLDHLEMLTVEIYDILINIFHRRFLEKVNLSEDELINIDNLREEFGDLSEVNKKLSQLISDNKSFYDFGGNRILMEFYKNILILKDNICLAKSNVINLNNDKI